MQDWKHQSIVEKSVVHRDLFESHSSDLLEGAIRGWKRQNHSKQSQNQIMCV